MGHLWPRHLVGNTRAPLGPIWSHSETLKSQDPIYSLSDQLISKSPPSLIFLANFNPYKWHFIKFICTFLPEIDFLAFSNLRLLQRIEQFCWFQPNWFKITHLKKRFWDIFNKKSTGFYQYMFKTIINFRINKETPNLDTSNS